MIFIFFVLIKTILGREESISTFGPALAYTRVTLSVSYSPVEKILSLKKKRVTKKRVLKSAVFDPSSSSDFSLPYAALAKSSRAKKETRLVTFKQKQKKEE